MVTSTAFRFPHHRLDAYRVSLQLAASVHAVAAGIPRGRRSLADQMIRASQSTVLLIAEGANRIHSGDKRHRYALARGECGECAAALEMVQVLGIVQTDSTTQALVLADRVGCMLTKLVQRFGAS